MTYFSRAILSCSIVLAAGCSSLSLTKQPEAQPVVAAIPTPILPQPPIPPAPEVEPTAPYYQPNPKTFGEPANKSYETQYSEYKATVRLLRKQHYEAQLAAYNTAIQAAIESARQNPKIPAGTVVHVPPVAEIQLPEAPQILIARTQTGTDKINVADLDRDLVYLEGKARHYAPVFTDKPERKQAEVKAKNLAKKLNEYAADPQASYDVLLRAMKANVIARNMDVGTNAAEKSIQYFERLFKLKPKDPETSYWYGFSLAEGGGFQESIVHLNVAIKAQYQEAYLALANTYLLQGKKKNAIDTLNTYKAKYSAEAKQTDRLIAQIKDGSRYAIWQFIPDPNSIAKNTAPATPNM